MFKSIQHALARRQESIGRQVNVADVIQRAVSEFMQEQYPHTSAQVSVQYQEATNTLVILTPSKTIAGELLLHTSELRGHLAGHTIRVERIVVR